MKKFIVLFVFLFFIISISKVNAEVPYIANYNYNLNDGTSTGFAIQEFGENSTYPLSSLGIQCFQANFNYSALRLIPKGNCPSGLNYEHIYVFPLRTSEYLYSNNITDGYPTIVNRNLLVIEPKQEIIIKLRYFINDSYLNSGALGWHTYSDAIGINLLSSNFTTLSLSVGTWINKTMIIAPSDNIRFLSVNAYFQYSGQPPTDAGIFIDDFKVYSFVNSFYYPTTSYNYPLPQNEYCAYLLNAPSTEAMFQIAQNSNYNTSYGVYYSDSCEDGFKCSCFLINNVMYTRRTLEEYIYHNTPYSNRLNFVKSNDLMAIQEAWTGTGGTIQNPLIITGLNTFYLKGIALHGIGMADWLGSGLRGTNWYNSSDGGIKLNSFGTFNASEIYGLLYADNITTNLWEVAGDKFMFSTYLGSLPSANYNSSWFNLFDTSCTAQTYCEFNNFVHINADCSVTSNIDCGLCGCYNNYLGCNFPDVYGTFCDLNGGYTGDKYKGYFTNFSDCSNIVTTGFCPIGTLCVNGNTTTNTIGCLNLTSGNIDIYVNNTGGNNTINPNCPNTANTCYDFWCNIIECPPTPPTPENWQSNFAGSLALVIGGIFGIIDLTLSKLISSIVFSFAGGILIALIFRKSKSMDKIFFFSIIACLTLFTAIGWFYWWLYLLLGLLGASVFLKISGIFG
jgi:hypothetical protein